MKESLTTQIDKLKICLENKSNIVITVHRNPDGDAIGSSLGLYNYLKSFHNNVNIVVPNAYPQDLHFLDGDDTVINFDTHTELSTRIINEADILFVLDYNDITRTEDMAPILKDSKAVKVLIDHHPNPVLEADIEISDTTVSSTCELVYEVCSRMDYHNMLPKSSANALYLGIMTDTGNFRHNCNNPRTFEIVARLLEAGAEKDTITGQIFESYTKNRMGLMGYCLNDGMTVLDEHNTAYIVINREAINKFNFKKGDAEGFVNIPLSIKNVYFSAIFIEFEQYIKISFRSRGQFAVNKFSNSYFNGGGHRNAAGGKSNSSLTETLNKFLEKVKEHSDEIYY